MIRELNIMSCSVISRVEVICISRELSSQGVNLLHERPDVKAFPPLSNFFLRRVDAFSDLLVREAQLLRMCQDIALESVKTADLFHLVLAVDNVL